MLTNLSNLKQMVANASTTITQSDTVQTVKHTVVSIPTQTKEYFYPTPPQYEMRSVVRLDDAFFVHSDIEEYITPGQQSQPSTLNIPSNIINSPIKPSGDATSIISWHDFELCVEDEALFDETEMGSYTTTNYSVTTGTTSMGMLSPHYNLNHNHNAPKIPFKQSLLNEHNAMNGGPLNEHEERKLDEEEPQEEEYCDDIDLNLDEDNPEKLFENLHQFRKSFIAKRKASGLNIDEALTACSAPPTSKSDGSYHRRLHTLDLDEMPFVPSADSEDSDAKARSKRRKKKEAIPIAPPHSDNPLHITTHTTPHHIARAIEGSREFGIDDIGIINTPISDDPTSSSAASSSSSHDSAEDDEDRTLSDISAPFDEALILPQPQEDEDEDKIPKHLKKVSISNKCDLQKDRMQFELDIDEDEDNDSSMDDSAYMKLQKHFSVERKLSGPRGSMKVTRISVSDELRETLMHQKSISMPAYNDLNKTAHAQEDRSQQQQQEEEEVLVTMALQQSSPHSSSNSSFGVRRQSELGDYVKMVSVTPRGLDPDNAKVSVIGNPQSPNIHYGDREYLKARNKDHRRTDSMDTQPDNDDQAPYISKQLTAVIRNEILSCKHDILSSSTEEDDFKDEEDEPPPFISDRQQSVLIRQDSEQFYDQSVEDMGLQLNIKKKKEKEEDEEESGTPPNKSNEGWQSPTGYIDSEPQSKDEDEKYGSQLYRDYSEDDDGYAAEEETTYNGGGTRMTLDGGNMLNVFSFIPYNENEYLPQELDESHDERIVPRFGIAKHLNEIVRFHWNGDALLQCDAIVIPITEDWTPISSVSHMLMNSAGSRYLEYVCQEKKNGQYISTGCAECCVDSFNLPSQHIIHCVPPKYDDRYPVASENAMNSCYWQSLEIASDLNCKTIVFPSIHPPKFFSEQLAIHILARTVRRFLERYHESISFESMVICVESELQMSIYTRIFTIYFPRDAIDLKYSAKYMPAYTGNACGGTVVKLRKQHIELSPLSHSVDKCNMIGYRIQSRMPDYETYDIYGNLRPSLQCMVEYKAEPEKLWKAQESKKWSWQKMEEAYHIKYKRYWNRCRKLNLKHMELYQFVYVGGQDRDGRDIIIFVGNRFPAKRLMDGKKLKQSLLYIIRELHHIVDRDYIIIYLHSFLNEEENLPPISWITQCFHICKERFSKNLSQFYVIHPSFRLKSWFYVLSTKSFYKNIVYLDSITKLEHHNIDLEHIALPGKSWEYERELFGEDKLADKMALVTDDLVLDALPYR